MRSKRAPIAYASRPAAAAQLACLLLLAVRQAVRSAEASGAPPPPPPPPPDCPEVHIGRRLYVLDNKCYEFVVGRPSNWLKAFEFCEERGGQLVQIKSDLVQNFLARKIEALGKEYQEKSYWIGANDRKSEGVWQWTDGTRLSYTKWFAKLPRTSCGGGGSSSNSRQCPEQADCAIMKPKQQYRWFDSQCRSPDQAFICEHYYVSSAASTTTTVKPPLYSSGDAGGGVARAPGDRGIFSSSSSSPQLRQLTPSPKAADSTTSPMATANGGGDRWQKVVSSHNASRSHWSPLRSLLLSIHELERQMTVNPLTEDGSDLSNFQPAVAPVTEIAAGTSRAVATALPASTVAYARATTEAALAGTLATKLLELSFRTTSRSAEAHIPELPPASTASATAEQSTATLTVAVHRWSMSSTVVSITPSEGGLGWLTQRPPARRANSATLPGNGVRVNRSTIATYAASEATLIERRRGNSAYASPSDERRSGASRLPPSTLALSPSATLALSPSATLALSPSAMPSKHTSIRVVNDASTTTASDHSLKDDGSTVEAGSLTQAARALSSTLSSTRIEMTQKSSWSEGDEGTTTRPPIVTAAIEGAISKNAVPLDDGIALDNREPHQEQRDYLDGDGLDAPAAGDADWENSSPLDVGGSGTSDWATTASAARLDLTAVIASASALGVIIVALAVTAAIVVLKRRRLKNSGSSISPSSPLSSSPPSTVDYACHRRGPPQWFATTVATDRCSNPSTDCQTLQPQSSSSAKQGPLPEIQPT